MIFPTHQVLVIIITAIVMVLVVVIWPEEVEEEIWIDPYTAKTLEAFDKALTVTEELKKTGWKTRKAKKLEWPWS